MILHDTQLCAYETGCDEKVTRQDMCDLHYRMGPPPKFNRVKHNPNGIHRLIELNEAAKVGVCILCGPVTVTPKLDGFRCGVSSNASRRLSKYGVTLEWYDERLIQLGNRCSCCGGPPDSKGLVVDHDHVTGQVRDLVCSPCNLMLGHARDNPAFLRLGAEYLEKRT